MVFRLRLSDGRYVFMEWHRYLGPEFFHDRWLERPFGKWWDDIEINEALDWFVQRGMKA